MGALLQEVSVQGKLLLLQKHYDNQHSERLSAGDKRQEHYLIFTTSTGIPIHPRDLVRAFKQLLQDAGLPTIHFHDLRHTNASLQLNQAKPVVTTSRRFGHAKASITLDFYGHLISIVQNDIGDMIDDLVISVVVQLDEKVEFGS